MNKSLPGKWRYNLVFGALILLTVGLGGQLALMLYDAGEPCALMADNQSQVVVQLSGSPGDIKIKTKRRFEVVATSENVPSCFVDPSLLDNEKLAEVAIDLGRILKMDPVAVQEKIVSQQDNTFRWLKKDITESQFDAISALSLPRSFRDLKSEDLPKAAAQVAAILKVDPKDVETAFTERQQVQFVRVKTDLSEEQANEIVKLAKEKHIRGVGVIYDMWRRHYPNADLAASVIGFVQKNGVAAEGVEKLLYKELSPSEGRLVHNVDAGRRLVIPQPDKTIQPIDGGDVYLTIDAVIQRYLQDAVAASVDKFAAKWGVGIVMNPNTGEVLAMTSFPTYDPNSFNQVAKPEDRMNRCFDVPFEPGSAFKTIIAAQAVNANIGVTWNTKFFCENGSYNAPNGGYISDHGASYGWLTLAKVIEVSSNCGMAKVGEKCGNPMLFDFVSRAGFGSRVPLELPRPAHWPGESGGIVTPVDSMDAFCLRRIPFGQQISVTAMQLTNAYCALVNGGELLQPRLIDSVWDAGGNVVWRSQRKVVRRVLRPEVSRSTVEVLQQVVDGDQGTGKACRMEKWTSFGKTGTAQIAKGSVYVPGAFTGTFIGGAPASKPELVCLISIYWPTRGGHYGATVAAPYVKEVLEKSLSYLEVPPDRPLDSNVASAR